MKVTCAALFLFAAQTAAFFVDDPSMADQCMSCMADLDDARDCLRICNDDALLAECMDPDVTDSIEELVDCCKMDRDCQDELEAAQECITECFPACLSESAKGYVDCVNDEDGNAGCSKQTCLDSFINDLEDEIEGAPDDLLDFDSISSKLETIDEDEIGDCANLVNFVDTVCDLGDDCCDDCTDELAIMMDCMINEVLIPYVAWEKNTTIDTCPMDLDTCALEGYSRKRALTQEDENFARAMALPKKSQGAKRALEETNTSDEAVSACQDKMNLDLLMYNITYATTEYMACVTAAGIAVLPDGEGDPDEGESSSAGFSFVKLVALVVGSAFFFM